MLSMLPVDGVRRRQIIKQRIIATRTGTDTAMAPPSLKAHEFCRFPCIIRKIPAVIKRTGVSLSLR